MSEFVTERDMPGAGRLGPEEPRRASGKWCVVPQAIGPRVQWLRSRVTGDEPYRFYVPTTAE